MEWNIIIIITAVVLVAIIYFLDFTIDNVFDWLFRLIGLQSGKGPLIVEAHVREDNLVLTIKNKGKNKMHLVAIDGRNEEHKRCLPTPHLNNQNLATKEAKKKFTRVVVAPGASIDVSLKLNELRTMHCSSLFVMDMSGHSWPVDKFNLSMLD